MIDPRRLAGRAPIPLLAFLLLVAACGGDDGATGDAGDDQVADEATGWDVPGETEADGAADADADGGTEADASTGDPFTFAVFGDLNGGGCEKNARVRRVVAELVASDAAFYVQTGDIIEGYGTASCFGHTPDGTECTTAEEDGNVAEMLAPLLGRTPPTGLAAAYFPVGGHPDGNWSEWYPDPCGDGICDFLGLDHVGIGARYLTHGDVLDAPGFPRHDLFHGDVCAKTEGASGYPGDFFYSFAFGSSLFVVLSQFDDYSGMLSCNTHPGYDSCAEYCSDPALRLDASRNDSCYGIAQLDWLTHELEQADGAYDHVFVFLHAPLLSSGESHGATDGADTIRALLEAHDVDAAFNGHNHAYERSHAVRGDAVDPTGTIYITVSPSGAAMDGNTGDWFTAATYADWADWGDLDAVAVWVLVTVDGATASARTMSLSDGVVDEFDL